MSAISEIIEPTRLLAFAGVWFFAAVAPGGNVAFTLAVSSRHGFSAGLLAVSGFMSALMLYLVLVGYGLGFAVSQYAPVLEALKWIGVGYLLYLAFRLWTAQSAPAPSAGYDRGTGAKIYAQGALICLTNPKAILFAAVVFPQAIDPDRPLAAQLMVLALTGVSLSFLVHTGYSLLGSRLGRATPNPRARRLVNRSIAAVFVVAALGLALARFV